MMANFTMLFGCDPSSGVPANTKLVQLVVDGLMESFDPEDGSAMIPECLGTVDALQAKVALESTSCMSGKSL